MEPRHDFEYRRPVIDADRDGGASPSPASSTDRRAPSTAFSAAPAPRLALLALVALMLCLQGARGLYEPDEGRYSATAWQMVKSGDWFTPRLSERVPHFTKPPLTYWMLAGSMTLLGRNEWALRLPIGTCGIFSTLLVYAMGRRLVPTDPLLAATVQATSLLPFVGAHLVTTDPLLTLCEALAVFGFVAAWWPLEGQEVAPTPLSQRWGFPLMWLGFGLAFLTKGPPGLLPLLPILVFAAWSGGLRALGRLLSPLGLLIFALVAFPWFLLQLRARPDLWDYFIGSEVGGRLLGVQDRNPGWRGLAVAFLPLILLGPMPWNVMAFARWRRRPVLAKATSDPAASRADRDARRFLWLWLVLPFLVFCAAQSRQPLYLLPLSLPASLLLARTFAPRWRWGRRERGWVAAWGVALLALTAISAVIRSDRDGRRFAAALRPLLPSPPRELVFLDRQPRYTAEIYFGAEVTNVELLKDLVARQGRAYRPLAEPLSTALARGERDTVWLVPPESAGAWQLALARAGWQVRRLGTVSRLEVFAPSPPRTVDR